MGWLGLIVLGAVLLTVAYYLGRADAPALPPVLRWLCGLTGAVCLVVGLIFFLIAITGGTPPHLGSAAAGMSSLAGGLFVVGNMSDVDPPLPATGEPVLPRKVIPSNPAPTPPFVVPTHSPVPATPIDPVAPAAPSVGPGASSGGYAGRYVLNAALASLAVLSVIGNYVTTAQVNGAFLGLGDIQWHWALLVFGLATALNAAFNRTPPVTKPPTEMQMGIERQVHAIRNQGR